jgi:hypothetical protein
LSVHDREHVGRVGAKDEELVSVDSGEHATVSPAAVAVEDRVPKAASEHEVRVPHIVVIGLAEHAHAVETDRRGIDPGRKSAHLDPRRSGGKLDRLAHERAVVVVDHDLGRALADGGPGARAGRVHSQRRRGEERATRHPKEHSTNRLRHRTSVARKGLNAAATVRRRQAPVKAGQLSL